MENFLQLLIFGLAGYLFGSLTPSIWIVKAIKDKDLRDHGSGHAGTTNTIRQAGWFAGLVVLVVDIAKGFIPVWLAMTFSSSDFSPFMAGVSAVIGHCWPIFARFRGGMGLATAGGAILAYQPLGFPVAVALLILIILITKHRARATLITVLLLPPLFFALGFNVLTFWMMSGITVIIFIRFIKDWNRIYNGI
ncbi:MAG TPA: glycerol-3-phosphate acyltransferase [Anaerolineales bacterium]|nr:glycerol-3-phosphate acyltransferase [Anaerolineales bacterium]